MSQPSTIETKLPPDGADFLRHAWRNKVPITAAEIAIRSQWPQARISRSAVARFYRRMTQAHQTAQRTGESMAATIQVCRQMNVPMSEAIKAQLLDVVFQHTRKDPQRIMEDFGPATLVAMAAMLDRMTSAEADRQSALRRLELQEDRWKTTQETMARAHRGDPHFTLGDALSQLFGLANDKEQPAPTDPDYPRWLSEQQGITLQEMQSRLRQQWGLEDQPQPPSYPKALPEPQETV